MTPTAQRPSDGGTTGTLPDTTWVDRALTTVDNTLHSNYFMWGVSLALLALLAYSQLRRRKRATTETNDGHHLTTTDRAVTRFTGALATAVLAIGMWDFFTDVMHLHPVFRIVLFAFVEAQIVSAWRRGRRSIHRHGTLGNAPATIYGLAAGSAFIAAWHAAETQLAGFRWFVAGVASLMLVQELAEELEIFLYDNPEKFTDVARKQGRIKWALTPERILVWLRLAEPNERTVEDVERQRRIARFARTAYRLHLLKKNGGDKPSRILKARIAMARWQLRRQTESANEHLNLASDPTALADVQSQIALLFGVESGTTESAVSGHNPLRVSVIVGHPDGQDTGHSTVIESGHAPAIEADMRPDTAPANPADNRPDTAGDIVSDSHRTAAADTLTVTLADITPDTQTATGTDTLTGIRPDTTTEIRRTVQRPRRRTPDRTPKWTKEQLKAFRLRDTRPDMTYPQIAREVGVADKTIYRWMAKRDAAETPETEPDNTPDTTPVEHTPILLSALPFQEPASVTVSGTNGSHYPTSEENR